MKWFHLLDKDFSGNNDNLHINTHLVSADLKDHIIQDLSSRFGKTMTIEETNEGHIDLPGMVAIDRPWQVFDIKGLKLEIPCEDIAHFMDSLKQKQIRENKYYKLHGFYKCLVLSQSQKDELIKQMSANIDDCEIRSMNFYKEMEKKNGWKLPRTNGSKTIDDPGIIIDPSNKENPIQIIPKRK